MQALELIRARQEVTTDSPVDATDKRGSKFCRGQTKKCEVFFLQISLLK